MTTAAAPCRRHRSTARTPSHRRRSPRAPTDVYRCQDHYVILCDLPGLGTGTLDIQVDGRTVTVRGHRTCPTRNPSYSSDRPAASNAS